MKITSKIGSLLKKDGKLLIGHSESLNGIKTDFKHVGDSIYVLAPVEGFKNKSGPIRTLIVDDSSTVRKLLRHILSLDQGFLVVGEAENPLEADRILKTTPADVMTLDIHMPEMDGITYLSQLKDKVHPPVVMISSVKKEDSVGVFKCFELGAVDYLEKPTGATLETEAEHIREILKVAAAGASKLSVKSIGRLRSQASITYEPSARYDDLILLGASTGGTEAIRNVLMQFPENSPPVVIVQHIPPVFSSVFAQRLAASCKVKVKEAVHGELLTPGHAYVAPGGRQLRLAASNSGTTILITDDAAVNRHKPSVDCLFDSATQLGNRYRISAALMTGMGRDGAQGLARLREAGSHTIAQDEATSVVFGMPRAAIELRAALEILPLQSIAYHLFQSFKHQKIAA